MAIPMAVD